MVNQFAPPLLKKGLFILLILMTIIPGKLSSQPWVVLDPYASGLNRPVAITHAGDSRLFVVEQGGKIRILDDTGALREDPFLDISDQVSKGSEQGLLGLAFHPEYESNGYFYVNYTDLDGKTNISRFTVSAPDPDSADTASEFNLLTIDQPYANHNAGDIKFGPDSLLYITTGDGGSGGDPQDNGQDSLTLLGKILRIDVDGGIPYAIPGTNPFIDSANVAHEIWALGLRNPWRFSFDRLTGDLWISDVGQGEWEEINFQPASSAGGENYGWRCYEGTHPYNTSGCEGSESYVFPVHEYSHTATSGCSVTGGYVYRGSEFPLINGYYFFTDYCADKLWSLHDSSGHRLEDYHGQYGGNSFSTFGEDSAGELYIAGLSKGIVYRITDTTTVIPDTIYTFHDTTYTVIDTLITASTTTVTLSDIDCQASEIIHAVRDSLYAVRDTSFMRGDTTYFVIDTMYNVFDTVCILTDTNCTILDTIYTIVDTLFEITETTITIVDSTIAIGNDTVIFSDTSLVIKDTAFTMSDTVYVVEDRIYTSRDTSCSVNEWSYLIADTTFTIKDTTTTDTSSTGIMFLSGMNKTIIYPNPASDYLEIEIGPPYDHIRHYTIRNIRGRIISAATINGTRKRISVTDLEPGIYILRIKSPEYTENLRFIKN